MSNERKNVPPEIKDWINKHYPRPKVDPEWVQDCYAWVLENNHISQPPNYTVVIEAMESQLLKSDLYDSTMHGTGLPPQVASLETTTRLTGPPITLQITAITDVGISAFQLEQVRKAREERMRASAGMSEEEDEEGEGGDLEIEGDEGPMPKYPRGTLMLHLSDGVATVKAMEYKPLPQLSLVGTPLGYKVQIKDVRVVRGVAHLEPRNITLKGGSTDDNHLKWHKLEQSLRHRLGLPQQPEPVQVNGEQAGQLPTALAHAVPAIHSPLRDVSAPPVPPSATWAGDDIGVVEDHRQHVPSTSSTLLPSTSRTPVARPTVSPYFDNNPQGNTHKMDVDFIDMDLPPTLRQAAPTLPEPLSPGSSDFSSFCYDEFDEDTWATLDPTLDAHASPMQSAPAHATPTIPPSAPSRTNAPPASFSDKLTDTVKIKDDDNDDNGADVFPLSITTPSVFPSILNKAPVIGEKLQLTPAAEKAIQDLIKAKIESSISSGHSASSSTNTSPSRAAAASTSPSKAKATRPKTPPQRATRSNAKLDFKLASSKIPSASPSKRLSPPYERQHHPSQSQHFSIPEDAEIITISDSDDADLELMRRTISGTGAADIEMDEEDIPVATRHVRRRTGGLDCGTQGTSASQALGRKRSRDPPAPPSATQQGTRRRVAIEPDDVIEISD